MSGVLVLDGAYIPVNYISPERAVKTMMKKKAFPLPGATIIATYNTASSQVEIPSIIKLEVCVPVHKFRGRNQAVRKSLIYARDNRTCQYCGKHESELSAGNRLTIDHVIPVSRIGDKSKANTWENMVTACFSCNNKKDNKMLSETGMKLKSKPICPSEVIITLYDRLSAEQTETLQKYSII